MSEITLNPDQLKDILKSAIVELIRNNHKEVSEFLAEVLEDMAMEQAIAEGETGELVSRESIWQRLGNQQLERLGINLTPERTP
jgi:hypothetical protein